MAENKRYLHFQPTTMVRYRTEEGSDALASRIVGRGHPSGSLRRRFSLLKWPQGTAAPPSALTAEQSRMPIVGSSGVNARWSEIANRVEVTSLNGMENTAMSNVVKTGGGEPNNATSKTTFGRSVESQAQISDAHALEAPVAQGLLNIYRLEPIAAPSDPRWANATNHGIVTVAARTAGDARIVASSRELDFMEIDAAPAEDVTTSNASAFRDDKLYTVIEVERDRADLARGVLEGEISVDTVAPVQVR